LDKVKLQMDTSKRLELHFIQVQLTGDYENIKSKKQLIFNPPSKQEKICG